MERNCFTPEIVSGVKQFLFCPKNYREAMKMSENNEFSFENPQYRKTYWHTCSHVMAQAVKRLWPEVKLAIGPSIDNGFYYDFDAPFNFTQENLDAIEAEMRKIPYRVLASADRYLNRSFVKSTLGTR